MIKCVEQLSDTIENYGLDRVNCFEKQIINVLNCYKNRLGYYFIMLCKVVQVYNIEGIVDQRDFIKKCIFEVFGINIKTYSFDEKYDCRIKDFIDNGIPVFVRGNLKELFYSSHYKIDDCPHLFLIKGYNTSNNCYIILDNTYISDLGGKETDLFISPELLYTVNKSFEVLGVSGYYTVFEKTNKFSEVTEEFLFSYIVDLYLSSEGYNQLKLLKSAIVSNDSIDMCYVTNINKFRIVFIEEIINLMVISGYDANLIKDMLELKERISNNWDLFFRKMMINIKRKKYEEIMETQLPVNLVRDENALKKYIEKFRVYFTNCKNQKYENDIICEDFVSENNEDNIIRKIEKGFVFKFNTGKIYNSWFSDDCPKVLLFNKFHIGSKLVVKCTASVGMMFEECNFQFGIFVRNKSIGTYFAAIDLKDKMVLDCFGTKNQSTNESFSMSKEIYLEIDKNRISCGIIANDCKIEQLSTLYFGKDDFDIGLACKTWGNGKQLEIKFTDIKIESEW